MTSKDTRGKRPLFSQFLAQFPLAIDEVCKVSEFGDTKYMPGSWRDVPNGFTEYSDALIRHLAKEARGESLDVESACLTAAHTAWNAMARLEILLRSAAEITGATPPPPRLYKCADPDCPGYPTPASEGAHRRCRQ